MSIFKQKQGIPASPMPQSFLRGALQPPPGKLGRGALIPLIKTGVVPRKAPVSTQPQPRQGASEKRRCTAVLRSGTYSVQSGASMPSRAPAARVLLPLTSQSGQGSCSRIVSRLMGCVLHQLLCSLLAVSKILLRADFLPAPRDPPRKPATPRGRPPRKGNPCNRQPCRSK